MCRTSHCDFHVFLPKPDIYCCDALKIAIMGCIVNGPGEMADADFGYVGGAPGKIDLYVGKVNLSRPNSSINLNRKDPTAGLLVCFWLLTLNSFLILQEVVRRAIAMEKATDALIQLIKDNGRWIDPEAVEN